MRIQVISFAREGQQIQVPLVSTAQVPCQRFQLQMPQAVRIPLPPPTPSQKEMDILPTLEVQQTMSWDQERAQPPTAQAWLQREGTVGRSQAATRTVAMV